MMEMMMTATITVIVISCLLVWFTIEMSGELPGMD